MHVKWSLRIEIADDSSHLRNFQVGFCPMEEKIDSDYNLLPLPIFSLKALCLWYNLRSCDGKLEDDHQLMATCSELDCGATLAEVCSNWTSTIIFPGFLLAVYLIFRYTTLNVRICMIPCPPAQAYTTGASFILAGLH